MPAGDTFTQGVAVAVGIQKLMHDKQFPVQLSDLHVSNLGSGKRPVLERLDDLLLVPEWHDRPKHVEEQLDVTETAGRCHPFVRAPS